MEPKTTNGGPMAAIAKEEEVQHVTHTFKCRISGKRLSISVTCNKAGTVEESLRRSPYIQHAEEKLKNKEVVIVLSGRAISSHCPCSLIKNGELILKYVKAGRKQSSVYCHKKRPSGELVTFNVLTKGGKNVVKLMNNPEINTLVQEITVYAYKGEKVKQALRRDGRFLSDVFKKNCALSHTSSEVTTEMSNLVDDLDGKTYKVILLNKRDPPDSQPSSLDDAYMTENESQRPDTNENQDPQQCTTDMSPNDNIPKKKRKINNHAAPGEILREIQNFNQKGKTRVSKPSRVQNPLRAQYGKSAQTSIEVKTMKKLMDLSSSICQVRINGSPEGTGFLLFGKFVLTNAHVVKGIYSENRCQLDRTVTVDFSFESLDQSKGGEKSGGEIEVEEVAVFEYSNMSQHIVQNDWALLGLSADEKLPDGLLTHFGFPPQSGGQCHLIAHPDGGLKKIDSCLIIPPDHRMQTVAYRCQITKLSQLLPFDVSDPVHPNSPFLTYNTCFYHYSSGSPVFDDQARVVAMHSGGYPYPNRKGEQQFVMEYGYHLSFVIKHIIVLMVVRRRFDVLKAYLACKYADHEHMLNNVKELVKSRNITEFQNVVSSAEAGNDESLKMFFEFFCQKEEPESMDVDDYNSN